MASKTKVYKEKKNEITSVIDFETDPFEYGKEVYPFAWDFFDGKKHVTQWHHVYNNPRSHLPCVESLVTFLHTLTEPHRIFAHNGGKFDFLYLLPWINRHDSMLVIDGRIVTCKIGSHILHDSYAMLPVALKTTGEKLEIDYDKLKWECRHKHKDEIIRYLLQDTEALFNYATAWRNEFGNNVTMASAAMSKLKQFHSFEILSESWDTVIREYFYGGRVQCFASGIINQAIKHYDINSMYPSVMKHYLHPVSANPIEGNRITRNTYFVEWEGYSDAAMPVRAMDGSLNFPNAYGVYKSTIHEFNTGLELDCIQVNRVIRSWSFLKAISFDQFIDHYYGLRNIARENNDFVYMLFWKLVMNSAYGKFAQNPRNFFDREIFQLDELPNSNDICTCNASPEFEHEDCTCGKWILELPSTKHGYAIMKRKRVLKNRFAELNPGYRNVATAASITGAARSILFRAIRNCDTPLYCDTDSLFCSSLGDAKIDSKELGAWKLENTGTRMAIAGKKIYALSNPELKCVCDGYGEVLKAFKEMYQDCPRHICKASKGGVLSYSEIEAIAMGAVIKYEKPSPAFKLDGSQKFFPRKIRSTVA